MEFSITELLSPADSERWLLHHFHPQELVCPTCGESVTNASLFRTTRCSQLRVYRGRQCQTAYNLYTGTVFQQGYLTLRQVILFLRGVLKGEPSKTLAAELGMSEQTILDLRHDVRDSAHQLQPNTPLTDAHTETDEMFQNAGKKAANAPTPPTRHTCAQITNAGAASTPMIARRLLAPSGGKVDWSACAWCMT